MTPSSMLPRLARLAIVLGLVVVWTGTTATSLRAQNFVDVTVSPPTFTGPKGWVEFRDRLLNVAHTLNLKNSLKYVSNKFVIKRDFGGIYSSKGKAAFTALLEDFRRHIGERQFWSQLTVSLRHIDHKTGCGPVADLPVDIEALARQIYRLSDDQPVDDLQKLVIRDRLGFIAGANVRMRDKPTTDAPVVAELTRNVVWRHWVDIVPKVADMKSPQQQQWIQITPLRQDPKTGVYQRPHWNPETAFPAGYEGWVAAGFAVAPYEPGFCFGREAGNWRIVSYALGGD